MLSDPDLHLTRLENAIVHFWLSNPAQFSSENVQLNQGFEKEGLLVKMTSKYKRLFLI